MQLRLGYIIVVASQQDNI